MRQGVRELSWHGRSLGPPRYSTTLRFNKASFHLNAVAQYSNIRFEPTYAYDIDPTVGSTAMPGFTEYMGLYRHYRVRSVVARLSVANKELFPSLIWMTAVNFDPGADTANYQNYLSSRETVKKYVGPASGMNQCTLVRRWTTDAFAGSSTRLRIQDDYSGSGTTAPVNNWWIAIGAYGDAIQVSGFSYSIDLDITIEFFEFSAPSV